MKHPASNAGCTERVRLLRTAAIRDGCSPFATIFSLRSLPSLLGNIDPSKMRMQPIVYLHRSTLTGAFLWAFCEAAQSRDSAKRTGFYIPSAFQRIPSLTHLILASWLAAIQLHRGVACGPAILDPFSPPLTIGRRGSIKLGFAPGSSVEWHTGEFSPMRLDFPVVPMLGGFFFSRRR